MGLLAICWPRVEGAEGGSGSDDEPELLSRVETLRSQAASWDGKRGGGDRSMEERHGEKRRTSAQQLATEPTRVVTPTAWADQRLVKQ